MSSSTMTDSPTVDALEESEASHRQSMNATLRSPSFLGLLLTQFLGAMNDNILRWLMVPIGKQLFMPVFDGDLTKATSTAVSLGLAAMVLPYLLLAAPAGYLADRFSKRQVIVYCKVAEIVLMLLAIAAIQSQNVYALFAVVFLIGCQAALFGPSKLGSIPELVHPDRISSANGLVGMTTVLAVIVGSVLGGYLYERVWSEADGLIRLWPATVTLIGVAIAGWLASLWIAPLSPRSPRLPFPYNLAANTFRDLAGLGANRPMLRVALGSAFFWTLASMANMNIDALVQHGFHLEQSRVGLLLGLLALGVAGGSVLAGIWSQGRVELGIVPLGALGIAVFSILLWLVAPERLDLYPWGGLLLFGLGTSAGLFDIPLSSYLQHRSPPAQRGSILAASNFLTFSGMLLASGLFYVMRDVAHLSPQQIFLATGVITLPVLAYIVVLLPNATIRFAVWLASHTVYRLRIVGREHLPVEGGALLVANHVTWLDGIFLMLASSRPIRMVAYANNVERGFIGWLARLFGVIPIKPGRRSIIESLNAAREAIRNGDLVCIFPEGSLTRTGQMHDFKPGLLRIVDKTDAPVIPIYLDGLWGSIFSFERGKFFWKLPRHWPYPVSIHFGQPLQQPLEINRVRQAVESLGAVAVAERTHRQMNLPQQFLRMARRNWRRTKVVDSLKVQMTGGQMLTRALIFRRLLNNKLLGKDERFVGLMIPPSVPGVLANVAMPLAGRVGVNLNYTVASDVVNACIRQCGIKHVLTSRKLLEKQNLHLDAEPIFLEDIPPLVGTWDKLASAALAYTCPVSLLERYLGLHRIGADDLLTIIFTSGSTGEPKGVMLSHGNIASNVEAMDQVVHLSAEDVAIGLLPFFHVFGYTALLWTLLALDPKGVYHVNPLDAHQVGKLCREHGVTLLMATPTFLRTYTRRCEKEDFACLSAVFAGAEKMPVDVADGFEAKFGIRPMEAYGASELSALVSANIPPNRTRGSDAPACKEGTVGRLIPGVTAKIVDPDSGQVQGANQPGMLWIKGPNVMLGYYNRPDLTADVIQDGWYRTGDMALIDEEGFLKITGRLSRFSKIGGEMVPHLLVEEHLQQILAPEGDDLKVVVTAIPDDRKGERLVVLHLETEHVPADLCKRLSERGLPNLFIPSPDSFRRVEQIPILGTGKLDLRKVREMALDAFGGKGDG